MDTEKVEKARNGNVDEIGNLLMENMKSMYRVAFSILKTEEEISDAISNTTVIVFEKIHTLKNRITIYCLKSNTTALIRSLTARLPILIK